MVYIKYSSSLTTAEKTVYWFFSGRKHKNVTIKGKRKCHANGIHDDTNNIQIALNNGDIYLPSGRYKVSSLLKLNTSIIGESP